LPESSGEDHPWPKVLASAKDLSGHDWQRWAVFDLDLKVPSRFGLKRHTFRPGHFQFLFEAGSDWLVMERLGPADVLLAGGDIVQWAEHFYEKEKTKLRGGPGLHTFEFEGVNAYEWDAQGSGPLNALMGRISPARANYSLTRIWQPAGVNKILVVRRGGRGPLDRQEFHQICEWYGVV
jgi:hypothetical protein